MIQTKDKDFLEAVQELQDRVNSLNMQIKYISEQMTTRLTMSKKVHVLQVNQTKTHEQIQSLTAEVRRLESLAE